MGKRGYKWARRDHHVTNCSVGLAGVRTPGNLFQFDDSNIFIVYYKIDYLLDPKGKSLLWMFSLCAE